MKRLAAMFLALSLILALMGCGKEDVKEYLDLGVKYLSEGNYEQAIIAFTSAIEIDPKSAPALEGRGDAYVGLGKYAQAIEDYNSAIKVDPKNAELYKKLGNAYLNNGETEKANEVYQSGYEKTKDERLLNTTVVGMDETAVMEFLTKNSEFFNMPVSLQNPDDISEFDIIYDEFFYGTWYHLFNVANSFETNEILAMNLVIGELPVNERVFNLNVCDNNTLQERFDSIFGRGHTDVRSTNGEGDNPVLLQLSNDTTALVGWGYGGAEASLGTRCKKIDININGGVAIFKVYCVYYFMNDFDSYGVLYDADGTLLKEDTLRHSSESDFDEIISSNGIDVSSLAPVDYVFYMTEDGVRFWGVGPSGTVSMPPENMIGVPPAPEITPETIGPETIKTVSASGGLRMRQGPGADYDYIQLIPDGIQVRSYAEQDGWLYINYLGVFGWASTEYCS